MNLMTILVKKDSISSKIKTVYYVVPASVRAIFIQDFATGEISYKVKNPPKFSLGGIESLSKLLKSIKIMV